MLKSKTFIIALISVFLFSLLAGVVIAKEKVKIIDGNKAAKGKLAPRFEAETITGETFNLESFRGNKCVIIAFWATWCGPCLKELPHLEKFYQKYKDTCVVVGISKDSQRDKKLIENKIKELKITFPIVHDFSDKIRTKLYPSRGIPHLIVIGRDGIVKETQVSSKDPANLPAELEKILGDDLKPKPTEEKKEEGAEKKEEKETKPSEGK